MTAPRLQYQQRDSSGYPPSSTMASPLISRDRPRPLVKRGRKGYHGRSPWLVSAYEVAPGSPLRLQHAIPVEVVEPAVVQVVGREQPAVAMQVVHRGLERHLGREHAGLL